MIQVRGNRAHQDQVIHLGQGQRRPENSGTRHPDQAEEATGQGLPLTCHLDHEQVEGQRDHAEVQVTGSYADRCDQGTERRCPDHSQGQSQPGAQPRLGHDNGCGVPADSKQSGVHDRQQPGVAHGHVQRGDQNHADQGGTAQGDVEGRIRRGGSRQDRPGDQ